METILFLIAAVALPFIAGLQRYSVAYGYAGNSKREAFKSAKGVFLIACLISLLFILWHFS